MLRLKRLLPLDYTLQCFICFGLGSEMSILLFKTKRWFLLRFGERLHRLEIQTFVWLDDVRLCKFNVRIFLTKSWELLLLGGKNAKEREIVEIYVILFVYSIQLEKQKIVKGNCCTNFLWWNEITYVPCTW